MKRGGSSQVYSIEVSDRLHEVLVRQVDGTECLTAGDGRLPSQLPQTVPAAIGRTVPPGYIPLGVAKEIVPTLREFGVDPEPVIREAGLDARLCDDAVVVRPFTR